MSNRRTSGGGAATTCKYFLSGACNKGAACPFRHDRSSAPDNTCRYFLAGPCVYGQRCRYDHVRPKVAPAATPPKQKPVPEKKVPKPTPPAEMPSSSLRYDAPEFVPSGAPVPGALPSYATAVSGKEPGAPRQETPKDKICPYNITGECYFGEANCPFTHGGPCDLCGRAVIHPDRDDLNREHRRECIADHEKEMEAAFAFAASAGQTCGICMDVVAEKAELGQRRFGILTNCRHCYCLRCIRQWRGQGRADEEDAGAGGMDKRTVRRCPECRVSSEFVVPSTTWVDEPVAKGQLIEQYRQRMGRIPCKYFGGTAGGTLEGECPFGNQCFYRHANPDGSLAEGEDPKVVQRRIRARRERSGAQTLLADFLELRTLGRLDWDEESFVDSELDDFELQLAAEIALAHPHVTNEGPAPPPGDDRAEAWLIGQLQADFAHLRFFSVNDAPAQAPPGNDE